MESYVGVSGENLVIPKEALIYGMVPAIGGATAFAVSSAYIAYVDTYRELPSYIALAKMLGITRQTVAKALNDLDAAGLDMKELGVKYLEEYA